MKDAGRAAIRLTAAVLVMMLLFASCAMNIGFKKAAAVNKLTVETAYSTIFTAHLRGLITDEELAKADELYDRYEVLQTAVATAIFAEDAPESARLLGLVGKVALEITDMVIKHNLEEVFTNDGS